MRSAIEALLVLTMLVSGTSATAFQPGNSTALSGSLISVAALKKLRRRYPLQGE